MEEEESFSCVEIKIKDEKWMWEMYTLLVTHGEKLCDDTSGRAWSLGGISKKLALDGDNSCTGVNKGTLSDGDLTES